MQPTKWRKRPVEVEAMRWGGDKLAGSEEFASFFDLTEWVESWCSEVGIFLATELLRREHIPERHPADALEVFNTEERAWIIVPEGHWVMRGVKGELYPCSMDVLLQTYTLVEGAADSTDWEALANGAEPW